MDNQPACMQAGVRCPRAQPSVHVQDAFQALKNTYGAVWEADTLPGLPLDLQIVAADGASVIVQ